MTTRRPAGYAEATEVSVERSRMEIERAVTRFGASAFLYGWRENMVLFSFELSGYRVQFRIPMPDPNERRFTETPTGLLRSEGSRREAYEQATRQRFRALLLLLKAKMEAITSGIMTVEETFFAEVVVPGGQTVYEVQRPHLQAMRDEGTPLPPMLPGLPGPGGGR